MASHAYPTISCDDNSLLVLVIHGGYVDTRAPLSDPEQKGDVVPALRPAPDRPRELLPSRLQPPSPSWPRNRLQDRRTCQTNAVLVKGRVNKRLPRPWGAHLLDRISCIVAEFTIVYRVNVLENSELNTASHAFVCRCTSGAP